MHIIRLDCTIKGADETKNPSYRRNPVEAASCLKGNTDGITHRTHLHLQSDLYESVIFPLKFVRNMEFSDQHCLLRPTLQDRQRNTVRPRSFAMLESQDRSGYPLDEI